jgi:hypothetical protein
MSPRSVRTLLALAMAVHSATALAEPGYFLRVIKPDGTSSLSGRPAYQSASPAGPGTPGAPETPVEPEVPVVVVPETVAVPASVTLEAQTGPSGPCTAVSVTNLTAEPVVGMAWEVTPTGQAIGSCAPDGDACTGTLAGGASCVYGARVASMSPGDFAAAGAVSVPGKAAKSVALSGSSTYAPPRGAGSVRPTSYYLMEYDRTSDDVAALYDGSDGTYAYVSGAWVLELRYDVPVTVSQVTAPLALGAKPLWYEGIYFEYWDAARNAWEPLSASISLTGAGAGQYLDKEFSVSPVSSTRFRLKNGTGAGIPVFTFKLGDATGFPP